MGSVSVDTGLHVVEEEEEVSLPKEHVINYLIGTGVNAVAGSYNEESAKMAKEFVSLSMRDISPVWQFLNDKVKIMVLNEHREEFVKWVESF